MTVSRVILSDLFMPEKFIKLIDVKLNYKNPFNVSKNEASKFVLKSLSLAHNICLDTKNVAGMINCPLDKTLLRKKFYGVTEFLASKCKVKKKL